MDYELEALEDAIIEDTVHCDLCGASWVLGWCEDGLCVTLPRGRGMTSGELYGMSQLKLCNDCATFVALSYDKWRGQMDTCEHGIITGEWCEPCNEAYKRAREEQLQ